MGRYDWNELLKQWQTERLTPEQAIGQLVLWGQEASVQLTQLTVAFDRLQHHMEINEARLERLERRPPI